MSLEVGFEVLKAHTRPRLSLCLLLVDQDVALSQLLLQHRPFLQTAMLHHDDRGVGL